MKKTKFGKKIVKNKLLNQAYMLSKIDSEKYKLLLDYIIEVQDGDSTNREGHAAKVYFNALFGNSFSRRDDSNINSALNYGYEVLLSTFNKEIINNGYLTQLGIHHKNEFNKFNLGCDLMEPFRIVIDNFVYYNQDKNFDSNLKIDILDIFNHTFKFDGKNYTLKDIIRMYVKNTLDNISDISNYKDFLSYEE